MVRWRLGVAVALGLLVALPLAVPLAQLLAAPDAWRAWAEPGRPLGLARTTALLIAGTLALSLPAGVAGAVLLYRTDLPLRRWLRLLVLLTLFVPLPLFTSGWQAVVGSGGWLPLAIWNLPRPDEPASPATGAAWSPWGQGIGSAVWVQAVAALPWVVLLVGQGLCWVERELEEDALTAAGSWRVLWQVSLRRSAAAVAAAALWVALQTGTEITVTDVMQVRTFAEEVYTQFVVPGPSTGPAEAVARAVAVTLPVTLLTAALVAVLARRWELRLPPRATLVAPPLLFPLGRWRLPAFAVTAAVCLTLLGLPLGSLVWRAGLHGAPPSWSAAVVLRALGSSARADGGELLDSLLLAGSAGAACALLALLACWLSVGARRFGAGVLILMAVAWAMPGSVVGLGLKGTINGLLRLTGDWRPLAQALWYGPSLVPLLWVDLLRFFPFAVAVLWPVVRLLPPELRDAARVDGARPWQELVYVVLPLTGPACLRAGLVAAVLSLGEISAGKLVSTPMKPSFAEVVFTQMHYGVTNHLAAQCLLLLAAVAVGGGLVLAAGRLAREAPPA
jgi:iron(III) transport system permease protein